MYRITNNDAVVGLRLLTRTPDVFYITIGSVDIYTNDIIEILFSL